MTRRRVMSGRRLMVAVVAGVVVLDQLTKEWALSALDEGRTVDVVWTLRLKLVLNRGTAFGLADRFGPVFAIVAGIVVVVLLASASRFPNRATTAVVGALAGGALGNLLDRVFREGDGPLEGAVVDFVDLQWWPVFNLADAAIVVGAISLTCLSMTGDRRSAPIEEAEGIDVVSP